jgi:hypothetical protein
VTPEREIAILRITAGTGQGLSLKVEQVTTARPGDPLTVAVGVKFEAAEVEAAHQALPVLRVVDVGGTPHVEVGSLTLNGFFREPPTWSGLVHLAALEPGTHRLRVVVDGNTIGEAELTIQE